MKNILFALFSFTFLSCEVNNQVNDIYESIELPALRVNNTFAQPFRILKTTISDASQFDQKYIFHRLPLELELGQADLEVEKVGLLDYYFQK